MIKKIETKIIKWIQTKVKEAKAEGVVIGLSGGIDSAVVAALCKKAFPNNTLGVIMPCDSDPWDKIDAQNFAMEFQIPVKDVWLEWTYESLLGDLKADKDTNKMAKANLKPRLRMAALYYYANLYNYLVVGTGNKSEISIGYSTKYGDAGVDILPIGDLLKTEVRILAQELKIPQKIIDKVPTAGLWEGQTDEGEMGLTYEELDGALSAIENKSNPSYNQKGVVIDSGLVNYILHGTDYDEEILAKVNSMIAKSEHKRKLPPICKL
jgi:NAD+ synthase